MRKLALLLSLVLVMCVVAGVEAGAPTTAPSLVPANVWPIDVDDLKANDADWLINVLESGRLVGNAHVKWAAGDVLLLTETVPSSLDIEDFQVITEAMRDITIAGTNVNRYVLAIQRLSGQVAIPDDALNGDGRIIALFLHNRVASFGDRAFAGTTNLEFISASVGTGVTGSVNAPAGDNGINYSRTLATTAVHENRWDPNIPGAMASELEPLPNSLVSVGEAAFRNSGIYHFVVTDARFAQIGANAFEGASRLGAAHITNPGGTALVTHVDFNANGRVREVPAGAFGRAGVGTGFVVNLPNRIERIGTNAFARSTLAGIGNQAAFRDLVEIGAGAYSGLVGANPLGGYNFNNHVSLETIGDNAFRNSYIPAGGGLGARGFGIAGILTLEGATSLTTIGSGAFEGALVDNNSSKWDVPATDVGGPAFRIPNTVTSIGARAFAFHPDSVTLGRGNWFAQTVLRFGTTAGVPTNVAEVANAIDGAGMRGAFRGLPPRLINDPGANNGDPTFVLRLIHTSPAPAVGSPTELARLLQSLSMADDAMDTESIAVVLALYRAGFQEARIITSLLTVSRLGAAAGHANEGSRRTTPGGPGGTFNNTPFLNISEANVTTILNNARATVYFWPNTGTGSMADAPIIRGDTYNVPANGFTAPAGGTFSGWKIDNQGNTLAVGAPIENIQGDIHLFAQWEGTQPPEESYMVTFAADFPGPGGRVVSGTVGTPVAVPMGESPLEAGVVPVLDYFGEEYDWDLDVEMVYNADTEITATWEGVVPVPYEPINGGDVILPGSNKFDENGDLTVVGVNVIVETIDGSRIVCLPGTELYIDPAGDLMITAMADNGVVISGKAPSLIIVPWVANTDPFNCKKDDTVTVDDKGAVSVYRAGERPVTPPGGSGGCDATSFAPLAILILAGLAIGRRRV